MGEAVVSVALQTLRDLYIQESRFLEGVEGQVKGLETELGSLQSLLKDADRKQHNSETIRNWIRDIKSLAYGAEDVLEKYVVKGRPGKEDRSFMNFLRVTFFCFSQEIDTLHDLVSELERIKSSITDLIVKMNSSGIQALTTRGQEEASDENIRNHIRKTRSHEELTHFVGMEEDIEKLVSLLVSDEESGIGVIGVWGMGGSGKTTVAKKVYKHDTVKESFASFAWVCITQKIQGQSVIEEIFQQLFPDVLVPNVNKMEEQIYNLQKEKKCLIVLDDIWNVDDWKYLKKCFPEAGSLSKVLLTTRKQNVADFGYPIRLKGLTEDEAWELLSKKAFAKLKEPSDNSEYEKLGRNMIRKCDRLPLAVAVLGGILSAKDSLNEWKLASEDVNSYMARAEGTGLKGEVEKVLTLSYDELPYHLKPCFLSLGHLQEDAHESIERIYELWMAEGLVQVEHVGSHETTMRDVATCYLNELKFRSMVQLDDVSELSLHDSMLDMCRSKAKEEEYFLKVVGNINISGNAFRLFMHVDDEGNHDLDILKAIEGISSLRCVQIISNVSAKMILPQHIFNLPQLKSLRTLNIVYCDLKGINLHEIENLIHLRFLGLKNCEWEKFSLEFVHKLSFLQTLDLSGMLSMKELPPMDTFRKMQQRLRHLYLPSFRDAVETKGMLRLRNWPQLETLHNFKSKFYDSKDLVHFQKLRTLGSCEVNDDESLEQVTSYICGSTQIREIDICIRNCSLDKSDALRKLLQNPNLTLRLGISSACQVSKLPQLETEDLYKLCPGLVEFSLRHTKTDVTEDIMQALDKFPNLKKLELRSVRFSGKEIVCVAKSFPRLEQLYLYGVEGKFELRIDDAAMPNLLSMDIVKCSGISLTIPKRLASLAKN